MKKSILSIIFVVLAILILDSCNKEEVKRDKKVNTVDAEGLIINKETVIINLEEIDVVDLITEDSVNYNNQDFALYEVKIEGSIEDAKQIKVGTVLNIPTGNRGGQVMMVYEIIPTEENPEKGVGAYILKAIQVTLDMYFTYADPIIKFSTPDNRSKMNSVYEEKLTGSGSVFTDHLPTFKSELEGLIFTTSVEQLFKGSLSTKIWQSGESFIEVNGSFGIHPSIDLYMEYEPQTVSSAALNGIVGLFQAAVTPDLVLLFTQDKNYVLGNMKQLRTVVYTDVDKDMSVKVHLEKEFDFVKRIPIGHLTIPTIPVSGSVELAFELDFEAMGTLDFETYKKEEYDIVVGVDLQRDLPDPVWYYEKAYREDDGFQLKAKIELTAGVSIILETEIYVLGIIGPEISVEAYVEAKASVEASVSNENPLEVNWELKADAGINGDASLNLAFLHSDPATWKIWEYSFVEYRQNIYTAPDHLKVISGADQQGSYGLQLPNHVVIGAYDSKDKLIKYLPVPVYFETNNGSVNSVDFTEAGTAEAEWILGAENENQSLNSFFKFDDVKKGEIEINATATLSGGASTVTDIDGNIYNTITIGTQEWMSENLKVTKYPDGTVIPLVTDDNAWTALIDNDIDAAYCYPHNNANGEAETYGALYTYAAAIDACPVGWHLPSNTEWTVLENYLSDNGFNYDGTFGGGGAKIAKALAANINWPSYTVMGTIGNNLSLNNASGFSALPGGLRINSSGITIGGSIFFYFGAEGYWWSSTELSSNIAYYHALTYNSPNLYNLDNYKSSGYAVRCVKE